MKLNGVGLRQKHQKPGKLDETRFRTSIWALFGGASDAVQDTVVKDSPEGPLLVEGIYHPGGLATAEFGFDFSLLEF